MHRATVVWIKSVGSPEWRASGASCAWLQRSCTRWGAAYCSHPLGTCCRRHRRWDWGARCETAEYWCSTPSARDTHSTISNRRDMSQSQSRRHGWHFGDGAYRDENLQVISHEADKTSWVVLFEGCDRDVDPYICKAATFTNVSWRKTGHCTVKQLIVNSWMNMNNCGLSEGIFCSCSSREAVCPAQKMKICDLIQKTIFCVYRIKAWVKRYLLQVRLSNVNISTMLKLLYIILYIIIVYIIILHFYISVDSFSINLPTTAQMD